MKVVIDATPQELAQEGEMLRAHLDELLESGRKSLAKSQVQVKAQHPAQAIRDMSGLLQDRYNDMLKKMNAAVIAYLASQVGQEPN